MQDAVILANHIYDIKPTSFNNIKTALSDYKQERFGAIKDQYPQSHMSAKLIFGHVCEPENHISLGGQRTTEGRHLLTLFSILCLSE
jgi:hypothetical protein